MKFENKIYVIFDKLNNDSVDCWTMKNKEVSIRWLQTRLGNAIDAKNWGLIALWRDCLLLEIDMSKDIPECKEILSLDKFVPTDDKVQAIKKEMIENEKN